MYVLFALLGAVVLYGLLVVSHTGVRERPTRFALVSLAIFVAGLILFNLTSRAIGIDLGPGRPVSYSIPDDYLTRGGAGVIALTLYALTGVAPIVALFFLGRKWAVS